MLKSYLPANRNPMDEERPSIPGDFLFLFPVVFLLGIGMVMVYSASSAIALKKMGTDTFFLKKQSLFCGLGIGVMLFCRWIPLRLVYWATYPLLLTALGLLVAVQVPGLGLEAGGAVRWLRIGPLSFQPAEFARLALLIYLAYSISRKGERVALFSIGFLPHFMVMAGFVWLIMLQPDFGSAIILFAITWLMLFVGGIPLKHLLLTLISAVPVAYMFLTTSSYRMKRILSFWDPWQYAQDAGYQAIHSLMAFGTGGLWGVGLGKGYQKLFYLPEPHTDFIFSVIGEELGLLGVTGVVLCFGIIVWNGVRVALAAQEPFQSLLAMGLTAAIGFQVCMNMGVALALLPTKGLTLPFISYGGTSLIMNMAAIGLLMNIAASVTADETP